MDSLDLLIRQIGPEAGSSSIQANKLTVSLCSPLSLYGMWLT